MLGYPGAGKTTVAMLVSELTGAAHIWADHERKQRYGEPTYSQSENNELYGDLNDKTALLLSQGESVMYDTAFNHYEDREHMRSVAKTHGARTILLWIQTPRDTAKKRATIDAHVQPTRVLNYSIPMHHEHFEYLSDKLEEPQPNEEVVKIDGTKVTKEYLKSLLSRHDIIV